MDEEVEEVVDEVLGMADGSERKEDCSTVSCWWRIGTSDSV